ncbi:phage tail protein [Nocardia sp. GCM10030253]|uniref:phage tail protein n=1 Tax=Nocardia sp. GCM10030253 TaxID=3273404 RepID=UPI003635434B
MQIQDKIGTLTFAIDLGNIRVETVQDVSGISEASEGKPGEVRITRGLDRSQAFTDWINLTSRDHDPSSTRQNVTITAMDANKKPVHRIILHRAWCSSWTGPSLEADNTGPASETVTLAYDDMRVEQL